MKLTIIISFCLGLNLCFLPVSAHIVAHLLADTSKVKSANEALMNKFQLVCNKFSEVNKDYTLAGTMTVIPPMAKASTAKFLMCREGDSFYYMMGETVTINEHGLYLNIDRQSKRILISQQKQLISGQNNIKQLTAMAENIRSEHYAISSKMTGSQQTISLVNEHHISCKAYVITFNRVTLKVSRLYMRLTDFNNPLRKDKDQVVEVGISAWTNTGRIQNFLSANQVVKKVKGKWNTLNEFKNYTVIVM